MEELGWIVLVIALCLLGALVVSIAVGMPLNARYERRLRQWADQQGYAVIRMDYRRIFPVPMVGMGNWYVEVEDEEGGVRTARAHFGSHFFDVPWGKLSVQWE